MNRTAFALLTALTLLVGCGGGSSRGSGDPVVAQPQADDSSPFELAPSTTETPTSQPAVIPESDAPISESTPASDPAPEPESDAPPQNQGADRVVVIDPNDADCSGLIGQAVEMYGQPTERNDIASIVGGPIDTAIIGWFGIETIVVFQTGESFDGCKASYEYGGPAIGVPAIEPPVVTPEPEAGTPENDADDSDTPPEPAVEEPPAEQPSNSVDFFLTDLIADQSFGLPGVKMRVTNNLRNSEIYNVACDVHALDASSTIIDSAFVYFANGGTIKIGESAEADGTFFSVESLDDIESTRFECDWLLR